MEALLSYRVLWLKDVITYWHYGSFTLQEDALPVLGA